MAQEQLFKKAAVFTDIHFGLKHNSRQHNNDCQRFVEWFCEEAKARGCDTCFFLGDWHHHRASINVTTLNYTLNNLETLNNTFEKVYFITGNHDLYYREKRDMHSLPMLHKFPNIVVVDEILVEGDVAVVPWLVANEWKDIEKIKSKYMFGHFEIPHFYMNALVSMPDHGTLQETHFINQEYVFSGHFHKRQQRGKVHYVGNPFGHNYADIWDFERGAMFLEWGGVPEYVDWENGPRYITLNLSELLEYPDKYLNEYTHAKVTLDVDISYEEANFLRETFQETYNIRELRLIPKKDEDLINTDSGDITFETVDQIVTDQLTAIDSQNFDKNKLIEIYSNL
jgi:DNA repair exonuclease SbcCD nuclease subunit